MSVDNIVLGCTILALGMSLFSLSVYLSYL